MRRCAFMRSSQLLVRRTGAAMMLGLQSQRGQATMISDLLPRVEELS